jgi:hypothetical protein
LKGYKIVKNDDLTQKAEKALKDCIQSAPFVQLASLERKEAKDNLRPDFTIRINTPDGEKLVYVEYKNSGQPRYARQAINQLELYTQKLTESYGVFLAPYISPASAQMCKDAGLGYVDFAGNCFVSFNRVFINIEGKPNPFSQSRDLRTIFSPRASRIIRVLLSDPFTAWKVDELSKKAEVSLGLVAEVKKILLDKELITEKPVGFALTKPKELFQEWASQYSYRRNRILDFYSLKDELTIEQELSEYCSKKNIRFALTLFSGASRVAPYTRFKRVFAYVEAGIEEMQNALGLKTVTSGPNVTLLGPYDQGVLYGTTYFNQMPVVSPIQLYLDLNSYKGRGDEAAQFLYEQVIEPLWSQKSTTEKEK